jgi:hypothetical protein
MEKQHDEKEEKNGNGGTFCRADNPHIGTGPFRFGKPRAIELRLIDMDGKEHILRPNAKVKDDFNSRSWVTSRNRWYNTTVKKLLGRGKNDKTRDSISLWSVMEKEYLEHLIRLQVRKKKRALGKEDWEEIAKAQNGRFEGTTLRAGHRLVRHNSTGDEFSRKERIIGHRTGSTSLRSTINVWADTKRIYEDALKTVGLRAPVKRTCKRKALVIRGDIGEESDGEEDSGEENQNDDDAQDDDFEMAESQSVINPNFIPDNYDQEEAIKKLTTRRQIAIDRGTYIRGG